MKPKRIILIRHGESESNADKTVRARIPDHRISLTDAGKVQASDAGSKLKSIVGNESIRAYVSPYLRARQTLQEIHFASGDVPELNIVKSSEDPRIREQDFGHLRSEEAFRLMDAERSRYGTFFYRIEDGESGADVFDRISSFLDTLWRDFDKPDYPENALIVSHGLTIRLFCMRWFHWSVEKYERLRNPFNCEMFILESHHCHDGVSCFSGQYANGKYVLKTPFREYAPEEQEEWKVKTFELLGAQKLWK